MKLEMNDVLLVVGRSLVYSTRMRPASKHEVKNWQVTERGLSAASRVEVRSKRVRDYR